MRKIKFKNTLIMVAGLAFLFVAISILGQIFYLEVAGVETKAKIITFDEKTYKSKGREFKEYIPVVRISENGEEINIPVELSEVNNDLIDFVGSEVSVKYSKNNKELIIINEAKYLLSNIILGLFALQIGIVLLISRMLPNDANNGKAKYKVLVKGDFSFLVVVAPGFITSILYLYYQSILGIYAWKDFGLINILKLVLAIMIFALYIRVLLKFVKKKLRN